MFPNATYFALVFCSHFLFLLSKEASFYKTFYTRILALNFSNRMIIILPKIYTIVPAEFSLLLTTYFAQISACEMQKISKIYYFCYLLLLHEAVLIEVWAFEVWHRCESKHSGRGDAAVSIKSQECTGC